MSTCGPISSSVGALREEQSSAILSFLRPHAPRAGARVLDVGCGFGSFLHPGARGGLRVSPASNQTQMRARAPARCSVRVLSNKERCTRSDRRPVPPTWSPRSTCSSTCRRLTRRRLRARWPTSWLRVALWLIKVPSTEGLYYRLSALMARVAPPIGATFMRRLWQTDYEFPHTVYFDRSLAAGRWLRRHGFTLVAYRYLPEVPTRTIIDRLTHDGDISRALAYAWSRRCTSSMRSNGCAGGRTPSSCSPGAIDFQRAPITMAAGPPSFNRTAGRSR